MDLKGLNNKQQEAVLHTEGPLLVLAGAGSGKTRVLTHRIAYLIENKKVFPSEILAITFTNKAAGEMKARIEGLIGPVSSTMWVGTFHAVCVRILRTDGSRIGYERDFVIYDGTDQKTLVKSCLKEKNIDPKIVTPKFVLGRISEAKNAMLNPEAFQIQFQGRMYHQEVCKIYALYQEKLKQNNAMDFDDLILKTIELLKKNQDVREAYQKRFRYVLVDEYQDTNRAQYALIRLLVGQRENLCVVGDTDQSIYGWRGADIRNIRDFEMDFKKARTIKLEQNYRSTKHILNAANGVIENNTGRQSKNLWTDQQGGAPIRYYMGQNEYDEGRYVIGQIQALINDEGYSTSEFAILYRTNAQSRVFESCLQREGFSYRIVGGHKFYDRKEIKDALSYLRLIQNTKDDVSFLRVVNEPKRGIGLKTLETIAKASQESEKNLFEAARELCETEKLSKKARTSLLDFVKAIDNYKNEKEKMSVSQILEGILKDSGYKKSLEREHTVESQGRLENIEELIKGTWEFENAGGGDLETFLAEISLMSDIDGLEDEEEGILLMTLHAAKGLEFPVVFLVGMEEGIFPTGRALDDDESMEEERRLAYVGMTRAEERLYVTHAYLRNQFGRTAVNPVSRFIEEIPQNILESLEGPVASRKKHRESFRETMVKGFHLPKEAVSSSISEGELKPGTKVRHKIFGEGTIISVSGMGQKAVVTIAFDKKGIKKLQVGMAPLEILL